MNTLISGKIKLIIHAGFAIGLFTILIGSFPAEAQQSTDDVVSEQILEEVRQTKKMINKPVKIQQANASDKEMTIEVQPNIIEMPGGEAGEKVAKVPLRRTRVRNTELRDLNALYNAVSVERIYESITTEPAVVIPGNQLIPKKGKKAKTKKRNLASKRILRKKGGKFFESSESLEPAESQSVINEESISVVNDIFIVSFKDYKDNNGQTVTIDLDAAVKAYGALSVVVSAEKN